MTGLIIDLQNGFENDEVIVRAAGRELLKKTHVKTNLAISLAESCPVEVGEGPVSVEVLVPSRNLRGAVEIDPARTPYLGVSIREGELELKPSESLFFYF